MAEEHRRADYGVEAPGLVRNFVFAGISSLALCGFFYYGFRFERPALAAGVLVLGLLWGLGGLALAALTVWGSRFGKLRERDRILEDIPWRGDEAVLEAGCGRGLFLVGAAKRLTTGRAVGVDPPHGGVRTGSGPGPALENARAEGVEERVEVLEAEPGDLPFEDGSFDVVLSAFALHDLRGRDRRREALQELARVLKPGGRLAVLDHSYTGEYAWTLRACGLAGVERSALRFGVFPPARVVEARKPG